MKPQVNCIVKRLHSHTLNARL